VLREMLVESGVEEGCSAGRGCLLDNLWAVGEEMRSSTERKRVEVEQGP
jgi:hypothetical protein